MTKNTLWQDTESDKPISTPASIFETPEAEHCPYLSLAILYLPAIQPDTWQTLLTMAETGDGATFNMMVDQLSDAASTLTQAQKNAFIKNLKTLGEDSGLVEALLEQISATASAN